MCKTHLLSKTSEYRSFTCAKRRCNIKESHNYKYYGGRGIKFLIKDITELINDIGLKTEDKRTLDRIDNNGNYEIGNIRWSSQADQNKNRRKDPRGTYVEYKGILMSLTSISKEVGCDKGVLIRRYNKGLRGDELFNIKVGQSGASEKKVYGK